MIRKTTPQDLPATHHPKATTVWIAQEAGAFQAVFGCTQRGFLNCEAPVFNPDWSAGLRRATDGRLAHCLRPRATW